MKRTGPDDDAPATARLGSQAGREPSRLHVHVIVRGQVRSQGIPETGELVIGRGSACGLRIDDPSISRAHARLCVGARSTIEDLGSGNGTRVRDGKLAPRTAGPIGLGEVIEVGEAMLVIQRGAPPSRPRRLWPHSYFEGRLDDECARAERTHGSLAVIRLRGPDTPAARLSDLEDVIFESRGAEDVVGSYGPTDYEILLPDASADRARAAVTELERAARARKLRIVVGAALYPQDGQSSHLLLASACATARGEIAPPSTGGWVSGGAMDRLHRLIERVAASQMSVLILGETGVGKEVLAETIHNLSPRAKKPLVRLNCAALPETLLESELFGHEKAAFTGAVKAKPGLLETAEGGTVFIDEVGELPLSTQVKLLRVIEAREVLRVGGLAPRPIDVRFLAATHRDLEAATAAGTFRQDLYFRINGFSIVVPPLRERVPEIAPLAMQFAGQASQREGRPGPAIAAEAMTLLERYSWPGNIRELRNVMERAVLLCTDEAILPDHLPLEKMIATLPPAPLVRAPPPDDAAPDTRASGAPDLRGEMVALERKHIIETLERCGGNQTRAAELLGISRRTLTNRLNAHGLPRPRKSTA